MNHNQSQNQNLSLSSGSVSSSSTAADSSTSGGTGFHPPRPPPPPPPIGWVDVAPSAEEEEGLPDMLHRYKSFINQDVAAIAEHFRKTYADIKRTTERPHVLVVGPTGSGKSSLINSIFGMDLAKEGTGVPITTHFTRYELEGSPVVVYDSKGVEHGHSTEFIDATQEFFNLHHVGQPGLSDDPIHIIWYVINSAGSRIHPFEEELWKTIFAPLPIMFLMNKSDISSDEDRQILRAAIERLSLPNSVGIFETVSGHHSQVLNVTKCPNCKSDDLNIRKKQRVATCESCHYQITLAVSSHIELITKTIDTLPLRSREAFIGAQIVSCKHKENTAKLIITEYFEQYVQTRFLRPLQHLIAGMLVRLAILWDFVDRGSVLGTAIAQDLFARELYFRERILEILRSVTGSRAYTTAVAILWNRCLRNLFMEIFFSTCGDTVSSNWEELVQRSFADLNGEALLHIVKSLASTCIADILEAEMPSDTSWGGTHSTPRSSASATPSPQNTTNFSAFTPIDHPGASTSPSLCNASPSPILDSIVTPTPAIAPAPTTKKLQMSEPLHTEILTPEPPLRPPSQPIFLPPLQPQALQANNNTPATPSNNNLSISTHPEPQKPPPPPLPSFVSDSPRQTPPATNNNGLR
ncbi:GTP binding protein [Pelomyxa schiedti]|nr:GTP binding protein [Pelomyxa schiedti]